MEAAVGLVPRPVAGGRLKWASRHPPGIPGTVGTVVILACLILLAWPPRATGGEPRTAGGPSSSRIEEAYRQLHAGRTQEAEALFRAHLSKLPRNLAAHEGLVWVHLKRGEVAQAARAADARLALTPGDVAWRKKWIEVVSETPPRRTEVIAAARALAQEHPRDVETHVLLGKVLLATDERLPEAVAAYRGAVAIDPGNLDARRGLARALSWSARFDEAIAGYRSVIATAPDISLAKELAETLVSAGRYNEAVAAYQVVVTAAPDDLAARRNLAKTLFSAGRPFEAMHVLDELLAGHPRDADALRARAQIARRQGDFETARNLLERAGPVTAYAVPRAGPLGAVPRDITLPLLFALIGVSVAIGYVSPRLTPWTYLPLAGYTAGLVGLALSWLYLDR